MNGLGKASPLPSLDVVPESVVEAARRLFDLALGWHARSAGWVSLENRLVGE
jgi:hypothetical protein